MTPELRASFRKARYELYLPTGTVQLAVDQHCAPLGEWLRANSWACAAWLTAFNPGGQQRSDSLNATAQIQLESGLLSGGYQLLHGISVDPSATWPPEPSLLVAGMSAADAQAVASDFGQVAFLWCAADAIPRLMETLQTAR